MTKKINTINRLMPALALLILSLALTGCGGHEFAATMLEPPRDVADYTLPATDEDGTLSLSDYEGQVVLLYFGYTYCPDYCPAMLYKVSQAMVAIGDDADEFQLIMVTVDVERDTLDQLGAYVSNFDPDFVGARTEDLDYLDEMLAEFGAFYAIEDVEESSDVGYLVNHTVSLFLVDREGNFAGVYGAGVSQEELISDFRYLARQ